jgi:hypothetical protein
MQLNCMDTKAKKWERVGKVSDFWHSEKSPQVVGAVIEDDQIILATRDTWNMGGPKVTVKVHLGP